jgi:AcrR family transcriptional regulator
MTSNHNKHLIKEGVKQQRIDEVVLVALELFSTYGIENTTMLMVAQKAEVGVASVYRYFSTKFDLALAAANLLWKDQINPYFEIVNEEISSEENGLSQVMRYLEVTPQLYLSLPSALRFLEYFDNFIVGQSIDQSRLASYAQTMGLTKSLFMKSLEEGINDGSIRKDLDQEAFYYTITHTLMSLAQKLILRGDIVGEDELIGKLDQVKIVIEMARTYIKNSKG